MPCNIEAKQGEWDCELESEREKIKASNFEESTSIQQETKCKNFKTQDKVVFKIQDEEFI